MNTVEESVKYKHCISYHEYTQRIEGGLNATRAHSTVRV